VGFSCCGDGCRMRQHQLENLAPQCVCLHASGPRRLRECLTGRYTPLSLISVSNCKRPFSQCTGAHIARVSPLNLYSAGSFTCRGFAPETVASLKPFSAAFRWLSSAASGAPARRKGLRMGIVIRYRGQHKANTARSGGAQWAERAQDVSRSKVRSNLMLSWTSKVDC
jgi:hypothetical protein